eukprot:TRINITY_DN15466_c0_g1_i13.p1 TRINITY_DN15466_c0_g1~~TRINITY_DN15466_c0_g1_i13.p1  ORF type:complete len:209 (+),score=66.36 TRINITY_DN15466_c0_g1_i13:73-699(+)
MCIRDSIRSVQLQVHSGNLIYLTDVINALKDLGYNLANKVFSYYSAQSNGFMYSGKDSSSATIPLNDARPQLVLKIWNAGAQLPPEDTKELPVQEKKPHSRRNKERKIGEIIEKVNDWRTLYTGTVDAGGKSVKYSLDDAAKLVGIAKKTLDDYLLQLRAGKKYGFDFQKHKDEKVGTLRSYVKEKKKKEREKSGQSPSEKDDGQLFG